MNKYEMLFIIKNNVAEESRDAVIEKLQNLIINNGGTVTNTDKWGMKKFAYVIDYMTDGYYVLMNFEADAEVPAVIERAIRISDDTLRCMILKK